MAAHPRFAMPCATALAFILLFGGFAPAAATEGTFAPVVHEPRRNGKSLGVVSASHPLAAEAGAEILRRGGNAFDAAAAVQWALGVVEPYMTGVGGGAFVLAYVADTGDVVALDGRETAPRAMHANYWRGLAELRTADALAGPSVGVPGVPKLWEHVVTTYGRLPPAHGFEPAIRLAEQGFPVNHYFVNWIKPRPEPASAPYTNQTTTRNGSAAVSDAALRSWPASLQAFYKNVVCAPDPRGEGPLACAGGTYLEPGDVLRQPDLARTLRLLQEHGSAIFYEGPIAQAIVDTAAQRRGILTREDLADYRIAVRQPIEGSYRGLKVYGMPPPSSGGVAIQQMLTILEDFDLRGSGRHSLDSWHVILEAMRLAFADRNAYLADADHHYVPLEGLLHPGYLADRRRLIDPLRHNPATLSPGDPYAYDPGPASQPLEDTSGGGRETTHFVVVDRWGNVVASTTTINTIWGNTMVVPGYGFLLNNQLLDFDVEPQHPNAPGPNKRPRSSMSPTLVIDRDGVVLALGAAGGPFIIGAVALVLLDVVDHGTPLQTAIDAYRLMAAPRNVDWEWPPRLVPKETMDGLKAKGHPFWNAPWPGWLAHVQAVHRERGQWEGGADARYGEGTWIRVAR